MTTAGSATGAGPSIDSGAVTNLSDIVAVAGGLRHSVALKSNGSLLSWGADELEPGFTLVPRAVPGLSNVIAIAAGRAHSLALCADGSVWSWGRTSTASWEQRCIPAHRNASPV